MDQKELTCTRDELLELVKSAVVRDDTYLSGGYQADLHLLEVDGISILIKMAKGWFPSRFLRRLMLKHEYRVYQRLEGFEGAPRSFGFLDNKYLLLERVEGTSLRQAKITDREVFFNRFLALILQLHERGVAHGDLKRKENLFVVDGCRPMLIDFGVAAIRKKRIAPINHFIFNTLQRFDFNAWAKLKCQKRFENLSPEDAVYYRPTVIERLAHRIKYAYLSIRSPKK